MHVQYVHIWKVYEEVWRQTRDKCDMLVLFWKFRSTAHEKEIKVLQL